MSKSVNTLLKEAQKQIEELTKKLADNQRYLEDSRKVQRDLENELESIHNVMDCLGVPKETGSGYSKKVMTVASRLFAWQAGVKLRNNVEKDE